VPDIDDDDPDAVGDDDAADDELEGEVKLASVAFPTRPTPNARVD